MCFYEVNVCVRVCVCACVCIVHETYSKENFKPFALAVPGMSVTPIAVSRAGSPCVIRHTSPSVPSVMFTSVLENPVVTAGAKHFTISSVFLGNFTEKKSG